MKAVLIGTGGVGSVTALALESTGKCEVTIVTRSTYEQVKEHGFEFDSVDYGHVKNWRPTHVAASVEDARQYGPFDYVLVTTKNIPEIQKAEDLVAPVVTPGCAIVLIQNGIGNEDPVMARFPDAYVLGGISMIGSANYGGKVKHTGPDWLILGTLDERPEAQAAVQRLHDVYASSKSRCEIEPNLRYRRWCKLVYNACYNTTAALTGLDTGRLYFSGLDQTVVLPAMREVRKIAEAELGQPLPAGIEQMMLDSDEGVYYEPSMLVDVKKGQPMELEMLLGNPLRTAQRLGIDTPVLSMLYKVLRGTQFKLMERSGRLEVPPQPYDKNASQRVWTSGLD